jgi:hypothetical protein
VWAIQVVDHFFGPEHDLFGKFILKLPVSGGRRILAN